MCGLYAGPLSIAPQKVAARAHQLLATAAPVEKTPFTALNAGLINDVIVIHIARSVDIASPIHVLSLHETCGAPLLFCPRVLVIAEEGAVAQIIETHAGEASEDVCSNSVVELFVGANAVIDHYQTHWMRTKPSRSITPSPHFPPPPPTHTTPP